MIFTRKDPAQLQAQLTAMKGGYNNADDKLWKPTKDSNGNASAVIRFLPARSEDVLPFEKLINHYFKKNGKTYFANCTSTHNDYESCPVCGYLKEHDLYNTNKKEYDLVKRKTQYWSNILVIKDPGNPENEGKVFKFRFGVKIMEKINAQVEVDTSLGLTPVDVSCAIGGANLLLKVKQQGGFDNYDDSTFMTPTQIPNIENPEFQKYLAENMSDLKEFTAKDKFDSYEKNLEKFNKVMGTSVIAGAAGAAAAADTLENELTNFSANLESYNATKPAPTQTVDALEAELNSVMSSTPAATSAVDDEFAELMAGLG